jgi:hypothetical protein
MPAGGEEAAVGLQVMSVTGESGGKMRVKEMEKIRFGGEWLWLWRLVGWKDSMKLAALDTCKLLDR